MRELREDDAERVVELYVETYGDDRRLDAEEIRTWVRSSEFAPGWLRVLEEDGEVVGYGDVVVRDDEIAVDIASPRHAEAYLDWAEREARERGLATVRTILPPEHHLADVCAARGYRNRRSALTLEAELDRPPTVAVPAGIRLAAYGEQDEDALREAINDAFDGDAFFHRLSPERFRTSLLAERGFDGSLWTVGWAGAEIAGFVLAFPEHLGDAALGWVDTLGVRTRWRRRGLGRTLLLTSFAKLYDRGLRRVGLGVDAENPTGALELYASAGMRTVRRQDNWVLEL